MAEEMTSLEEDMRASVLGALVLTGCDETRQGDTEPPEIGAVLSDFALEDVNATSATVGQAISPRDYQGMASAWYFGHAN